MKHLSQEEDLWSPSRVNPDDMKEAIEYATFSLPWTFDRMRYGPRTQNAVNWRLVHIVNGVLNQAMLERTLTERGYDCYNASKHYRDSDIFDFRIDGKKYDVKTNVVYSEYNTNWNRTLFTPELLIKKKDYFGPKWRQFFPQMITLSQLTVDKMKDSYIFGIAVSSKDLRIRAPSENDQGFWCAAPFGTAQAFFHSKGVIKERERAKSGFRVQISYETNQSSLIEDSSTVKLTLFGEWNTQIRTEDLVLEQNGSTTSRSEFSALSCIRLEHPEQIVSDHKIVVKALNNYQVHIGKTTNPKINLNDHEFEWELGRDSFVNLRVPDDYNVYWLGHISFVEFVSKFANYTPYFIPSGKDMNTNQPGLITPKFKIKLERLDRRREKASQNGIEVPWPKFEDLMKDDTIHAGILIVAMRGPRPIGAACYYYPPYAMQETAMYVIPRDLYTMDSL